MSKIISTVFLFLHMVCGAQSYFLNGDAQAGSGNCYTITPNQAWQNGTVWYANQLDLTQPFALEFYMNFGNVDANGADGMVFVLQTVGANAIGSAGGGLGFQGFNPSFGIEFDTFSNPETSDLSGDHVAFLKNGSVDHNSINNLAGPVTASSVIGNIEDGNDHIVKITWDPLSQIVELYFDCVLRLSDQNNLVNSIFSGNTNVYWGFTGATGGMFNQQSVCLQDYFYNEVNDSTICAGSSVQLAASGNPGGDYAWLPIAGLDNASSQTPMANPSVTTNYCYTYTDLCNVNSTGCIEITVEDDPVVSAGADASFCEGLLATLNATIDQPNALFDWSALSGNILNGQNTLSPQVNQSGVYQITASSMIAGCASTDEVEVTQNSLPNLIIETPLSFCPGESVVLNAGNGWQEILWYNNSTENTMEVSDVGNYEVTVTENECSSSATFVVNETFLPLINLGPDQIVCDGEVVLLDAGEVGTWSNGQVSSQISAIDPGLYSFLYVDGDCEASDEVVIATVIPPVIDLGPDISLCEGEVAELTIDQIGTWSTGEVDNQIEVQQPGFYGVNVVNGPCSVTDQVQVEVLLLPVVNLGDDQTYCAGKQYTIGATEESYGYFLWSTGEETLSINVRETGDYALMISNLCGSAVDSVKITFEDCDFFIYSPNAFTPDNDGVNDVFFVQAYNLTKTELSIFNRWGDLIFNTDQMGKAWEGDVHGGEYYVECGVYTYQFKYTTDKGDAGELRGHVSVIR